MCQEIWLLNIKNQQNIPLQKAFHIFLCRFVENLLKINSGLDFMIENVGKAYITSIILSELEEIRIVSVFFFILFKDCRFQD